MEVDSELGRGTTFEIRFPAAPSPKGHRTRGSDRPSSSVGDHLRPQGRRLRRRDDRELRAERSPEAVEDRPRSPAGRDGRNDLEAAAPPRAGDRRALADGDPPVQFLREGEGDRRAPERGAILGRDHPRVRPEGSCPLPRAAGWRTGPRAHRARTRPGRRWSRSSPCVPNARSGRSPCRCRAATTRARGSPSRTRCASGSRASISCEASAARRSAATASHVAKREASVAAEMLRTSCGVGIDPSSPRARPSRSPRLEMMSSSTPRWRITARMTTAPPTMLSARSGFSPRSRARRFIVRVARSPTISSMSAA